MRTIIVLLILTAIILILLSLQKRWKRPAYLAPRLLVTYLSLVMLLAAGEVFFRYAYAESGWGFTLAYQNWEDRFWKNNSLGFRDREWTPADWQHKTTIMILGDSFSAGWGIENPVDRYPDVLASMLGEDYAVVNVSRPGGTPERELTWAKDYPLKNPDIIIYQYYLNDIDDAALRIDDKWIPQFPEPPHWIHRESYLANFLCWRIVPIISTVNAPDGQSYWEWNDATYRNFVIFDIHRQELQAIMDYADSLHARLIVVIFPNMNDPANSLGHTDGVAKVFTDNGYNDILNLVHEAAAWNPKDSTVSSRDAHPSTAFHHRVAELIYQEFFTGQSEE